MKRYALLPLLLASSLAAAESGSLIKDSDLRAKPFSDAAVTSSLKAKTSISLDARQGAWAHIKTLDGKEGWVRLLNIRTGNGQKGSSGVGALASLFKTGSSGSTVSTGAKGISEEDLSHAQPNKAEAAKLGKYASSSNDAKQSAKQAKLASQTVGYLSEGE